MFYEQQDGFVVTKLAAEPLKEGLVHDWRPVHFQDQISFSNAGLFGRASCSHLRDRDSAFFATPLSRH
jgi:hypothetical protein